MIKKRKWIYSLLLAVLALTMIACSPNPQEENTDILGDSSWLSEDDDSQIVFNTDNSFSWYQSKEEEDDNYYAGSYDFYIGEEAMDYITDTLSEYAVKEEELQGVFDRNEEYELDNFVCFTMNNETFILYGDEQLSEPIDSHYFGFLLDDGSILDIANMDTGSYVWFVKE